MVDDKTVKLERFDKTTVYPELGELKQQPEIKEPKKKWSKRKKTAVIAGGCFFAFLFLFFILAYYHDEQVIAEQQQIHQKELVAAQKKQLELEKQKEAAEANYLKLNDMKAKAENYLQDVDIPKKEEVKQTVNEAEQQAQKAINAAQSVQKDPKVQAALQEHSQLINQVTQFLQEQKQKLMAIFNQTKAK
ncbi:MAG: hypothetical protein LLG02_14975 [Pelosinus sp.]|nr:hypothetical protein [Pelosinus sp.]